MTFTLESGAIIIARGSDGHLDLPLRAGAPTATSGHPAQPEAPGAVKRVGESPIPPPT
jgi:hypothetical protein